MPPLLFEAVYYLCLLSAIWAFIDCCVRRKDAFPAVDRQTKTAWLSFIAIAGVVIAVLGAISFIGIFAVVVVVYYFVDVRAKVIQISSGNRY